MNVLTNGREQRKWRRPARTWLRAFRPVAIRPGATWLRAIAMLLVFSSLAPLAASAAQGWVRDGDATVYAVDVNADGSLIVSGRRDDRVVAYDASGEELWTFETGGTVYGVAVSDAGDRVAVASEDRTVYLLDGTGSEIWRYQGTSIFLSVSITGDGRVVAAGTDDGVATLLNGEGAPLWEFVASDQVSQVALYGGEGGFRLAAGTRDSRVTLIGPDGQQIWQSTLRYSVRGLAVTTNGGRIVAGDNLENVALLDGGSGQVIWESSLGSPVSALDITADGSLVVAGTEAGLLATFDADGNRLAETSAEGQFADLALSADGAIVAAALGDTVAVYPGAGDGQFEVPAPESWLSRLLLPLTLGLAVILAVGILLGLRRQPNGERAWRGMPDRSRRLGRELWRARLSYAFLLPTVALLLVFNYYPAFSGIYHAFTEWSPGIETTWVGFDQFRDLRDNRYFWAGIGNLLILVGTGFLKLVVPLAVAEMIFHVTSSRLGYAFRTLFVLQVIVPGVVGVLLWVNVYDPNIGLANQTLRAIGLDGWTRSWLGDAGTAIWSIVFIGFPWVSAFALLIFYGGLISIPSEIFDSAALDGASTMRRIINIDLPLLLAQVRLLLILTFIATVQEFAAIFLTTGGGPGSATYVPSLELYYQAVRFNNFGAASAIGAVLFIVILGGTIINLRYVKSSVEYGT